MFKKFNFKNPLKILNFRFEASHEKNIWFLVIASFLFFLLRLPSLFEPYWYGDEGIYEVIGFALRHGRLLYSGIWDNKPPMLYLLYAIFDGNQTGARILSLLAGLAAVWVIFFLSKMLFVRLLPAIITTSFFAFFFAIPLIEGNIANAENFMLLLSLASGLLVLLTIQEKNKKDSTFYLLIAGLILGISFLLKVVAMFDLSAFAVFVFLVTLPSLSISHIIQAVKKVIPLIVGFIVPIFLCALFFAFHHTFSTFLHSTLFSNVSYVNYGNQLIIPQGFLILKTLIVMAFVLIFLFMRKKMPKATLFILLWVIFSIYSALFSGRPYTHYALIALPSFSLLLGFLMTNKTLRIPTIILCLGVSIFLVRLFTFYSHPFAYYGNFVQYATGQKTQASYQSFFDKVVSRDYAIAQFINTNRKENETIFVWGNSGQIYKLTNTLPISRFIVAYHITMTPQNFYETYQVLQQTPPTYIILLPNQDRLPHSLKGYQEQIMIGGATIYKHVI